MILDNFLVIPRMRVRRKEYTTAGIFVRLTPSVKAKLAILASELDPPMSMTSLTRALVEAYVEAQFKRG